MPVREGYIPAGPAQARIPDNRAAIAASERRDKALSRSRGEVRRFGRSGRLTMQVDQVAFMNAVRLEGQGVVHDSGYWEDMRRRHPWTDTMPDKSVRPVHVMRNRYGRVSWQKVYS